MLTTTEKGHAANPVKDKEASIALITDSQPSAGRAWDDQEQAAICKSGQGPNADRRRNYLTTLTLAGSLQGLFTAGACWDSP